MINRRRFLGSALAAGLVGAFGFSATPRLALAAPGDQIETIKAAAIDYILARVSGIRISRVELTAMSGAFATVRIIPSRLDLVDPATVVLSRRGGVWRGITYGTSFYDLVENGIVPGDLFDEEYIYTWYHVSHAIERIQGRPRTYNGNGFIVQYPPDATVDVAVGTATFTGPRVRSGLTNEPAYNIRVSPVQYIGDTPLDDWAFQRMQQEVDQRVARGDLAPEPQLVRYYTTYDHDTFEPINKVFQYDWFMGDSVDRNLLITSSTGGMVVSIRSRVYPPGNHPGALQADTAMSLIVSSLRIGQG